MRWLKRRLFFWRKPKPLPPFDYSTIGYEVPHFFHEAHVCSTCRITGEGARIFIAGKTHEQIARELYEEHGLPFP